jgi:6,7-dimethyl-8-ribityllumazine synthase
VQNMTRKQGSLSGEGKTVVVVVSRWNEFVTKALLEGAVETMEANGATVEVVKVPGAWEIPLAVDSALKRPGIHGAVALGCILQGATTHAAQLAGDVAGALMRSQISHSKPVSWGIITPENQEQAIERAGMKLGNKGQEAALACLEMMNLV